MSTTQSQEVITRAEEMFMRYGIKSVTMDDIARELGISKKTLYTYVDNKSDLIERIISRYISNQKKSIKSFTENSKDAIDEILQIARHVTQILRGMRPTTMFDLRKYYRKCWQQLDEFQRQHVYGVIKNNLERGMREGLYRKNLDPDIIAKLYVGKTMLLSDEKLFPARDYHRDDLYMEYISYHLHGILAEKGMNTLNDYQPLS